MNAMPDYMMPGPPPAPSHTTVLREEVVAALAPRAGGVYVDATLGAGGHTEAILEAAPGATMVAVGRDVRAIGAARVRLGGFRAAARSGEWRFSERGGYRSHAGISSVDG